MRALLYIDGYKLSHRAQYPTGTERIYSNYTPRGSRIEGQTAVGFLGLQAFCQRFLMEELEPFFGGTPDFAIEQYKRRVDAYLGPNNVGTDHIAALWRLGHLPLRFCAVPEGTYVPLRMPVLTVENTHPDFFWLVNYYETLLSCELWGSMTSMTTAGRYRQLLEQWAQKTGTDPAFIDWQAHDFSFRGMMGLEAAQLSGIGHLVHFKGTDTIPAIDYIEDYYSDRKTFAVGGGDVVATIDMAIPPEEIAGSVAATEHSVMCAGGQESERETILRLIDLYPSGIVSVVSDTWDLWKVITEIMATSPVKERILARDGKYVVRPDSGDPVKIICGDPDAPADSPARFGVVELLWNIFGGHITVTGHKLLDTHVGVIYGDSISYERAQAILDGLHAKGFASGNIVLGIGSYTYQFVTRDTYNLAMKATWAQINGEPYDLYKSPITDSGMKFSAKGRLAILEQDGQLVLVEQATPAQEAQSLLQPVWENGEFLKQYNWREIRENARRALGLRGW